MKTNVSLRYHAVLVSGSSKASQTHKQKEQQVQESQWVCICNQNRSILWFHMPNHPPNFLERRLQGVQVCPLDERRRFSKINLGCRSSDVDAPMMLVDRVLLIHVELEEPVVRIALEVLIPVNLSAYESLHPPRRTYELSFWKFWSMSHVSLTSMNSSELVLTKYRFDSNGP